MYHFNSIPAFVTEPSACISTRRIRFGVSANPATHNTRFAPVRCALRCRLARAGGCGDGVFFVAPHRAYPGSFIFPYVAVSPFFLLCAFFSPVLFYSLVTPAGSFTDLAQRLRMRNAFCAKTLNTLNIARVRDTHTQAVARGL